MRNRRGRGRYRGIYSAMVEDQDFLALSSRARHVLLTLRLGPVANAACLMRVYTSVLAEQTGYRLPQVEGALKELQSRSWIVWERPVVWIRNGLRFDPYLRLADPKHGKAVDEVLRSIGPLPIVAKFCQYYKIAWPFEGPDPGSDQGSAKSPARVSEGNALRPPSRVREREREQEEKKDPVVTREVDSSRTRVATRRPDDLTITRTDRIAAHLPTRVGDVLAQIGFRP
jgi:hypothetical protein